jgi:DNA-binding CsgD family transcriptional regulator
MYNLVVNLTDKQKAVAEARSSGLTMKEIATLLGLSYHTIRDYMKVLYARFDVHKKKEFCGKFRSATIIRTPTTGKDNHPPTAAKQKVYLAVRCGLLRRQHCEKCNNPKTEAHHDDYSKPLAVRWLCKKHHEEADRERRKKQQR